MACKLTPQQVQTLKDVANKSPQDLPEALRQMMNPTWKGKLAEAWKAGMLSPVSALAKASGDMSAQALSFGRTVGGVALERGRAALTGGVADREWAEIGAHIQAIQDGYPTMLRSVAERLRDENFDLANRVNRLPQDDLPRIGQIGKGIIPGVNAGAVVRWPFRVMGAISDGFSGLSGRVETYRQAIRTAIQEGRSQGLTGTALESYVNQRHLDIRDSVMQQDGKFQDIEKAALDAGKYNTFSNQFDPKSALGKLGQARNAPGLGGTVLHAVLPFYLAPMRISGMAFEHTPLNFIRLAYKMGQGELKGGAAAEELMKPIIGTMIGATFAAAAKQGLVTGSGPADPKARQALLDSGWQPYSIKAGDTYVSYHRLEPIASIMGMAADLVETKDERTQSDLVKKIVGSVGQNFTNKTFLKGLSDATGALHDPQQFAGQFAQSMEGSLVPSVFARAAQVIDPTVRKVNATDGSAILSRIPGLTGMVPEKDTALGTPAERSDLGLGGRIYNAVSPLPVSEEKFTPGGDLEREMARLEYAPSQLSPTMTVKGKGGSSVKVPLTNDEMEKQTAARQRAATAAERIMNSPSYQQLPDTVAEGGNMSKQAAIRGIFERFQRDFKSQYGPRIQSRARQAQ